MDARLTLTTIRFSHYNEKARWALDLKGVPHERVSLMPGPHAPRMLRLTGRTQTPALVDEMDDQVAADYAAMPERLYLIGTDGHVAYQGGMGPMFFRPSEWEEAIATYLDGVD